MATSRFLRSGYESSENEAPHRPAGVGVVGAGNVGAAVVSALALLGSADRVVLYDRNLARADGASWDIADGTPLMHNLDIHATDDWRGLMNVDVIVVTVGQLASPGESRRDERNGSLMRYVMAQLDEVAPRIPVIVVTNPVDVMTRIAQEASVRPWQAILGTGTVLDTARLRLALATRLGVDVQNTHVHMVGEHGDRSFPAWSGATIGPVPVASFPLPPEQTLADVTAECADWARRRGSEIFARKGHTANGIAVAVSRIVESVLRDQRRIFTVSTRALPDHGLSPNAVLSLPCILGRTGVIRQLPLPLDHKERQLLERAAADLEAGYRQQAYLGMANANAEARSDVAAGGGDLIQDANRNPTPGGPIGRPKRR